MHIMSRYVGVKRHGCEDDHSSADRDLDLRFGSGSTVWVQGSGFSVNGMWRCVGLRVIKKKKKYAGVERHGCEDDHSRAPIATSTWRLGSGLDVLGVGV